ncbi:hypothetical protein B4123_0442 [Bacillus paralicheniformis]|nr:hypothetical protein B4123_0442 [Bacillus paralicheniformis]
MKKIRRYGNHRYARLNDVPDLSEDFILNILIRVSKTFFSRDSA